MTNEDLAALYVERHPFCSLVNIDPNEGYSVSRVPVTTARQGLALEVRGHVSRRNSHWKQWRRGNRTLCVVAGPHGYVSPRCYEVQPAVPTWNHVTITLEGEVTIVADVEEALAQLMTQLEVHEPMLLRDPGEDTVAYYRLLVPEIVVFRLRVDRFTCVEKLSFHRSLADQHRIAAFIDDNESPGNYGATVNWRRGRTEEP